MQLTTVAKTIGSAILISAFTFASSSVFAQDTAQQAGTPVSKPKTAIQMCKEKFTDKKSKDYKACVHAARKAAKQKKK